MSLEKKYHCIEANCHRWRHVCKGRVPSLEKCGSCIYLKEVPTDSTAKIPLVIKISKCCDCPFCISNRLGEPWCCSTPIKKPYYNWQGIAKINIEIPDWCPLPILLVVGKHD